MLPEGFHATEDRQAVRDRVFRVLTEHEFKVDATILDKPKARPNVRDDMYFFQLAWYLHFKHVARVFQPSDELLVIAATLGTKKKQQTAHKAVCDVVRQVSPTTDFKTVSWSARTDPCLQVADYCCWAIQRKWEGGDDRSYALVRDKIRSEHDVFATSNQVFY